MRGRGGGRSFSYEDQEGLLTQLSVVSALLLSFVVGMFFTIPMEEFEISDFRWMVMFSPEFRQYVVEVMDGEIEEHANKTACCQCDFDFSWEIYRGKIHPQMDLRRTLLDFDQSAHDCSRGMTAFVEREPCSELFVAASVIQVDCPHRRTLAYCGPPFREPFVYGAAPLNCPISTQAWLMMYWGGGACALATLALFGSLVLYISLAYSSAREDLDSGTSATLENWERLGRPCTFVLYALFLIATVCFFIGLQYLAWMRLPGLRSAWFFRDVVLWLMPAGIGCTLIMAGIIQYQMGKGTAGGNSGEPVIVAAGAAPASLTPDASGPSALPALQPQQAQPKDRHTPGTDPEALKQLVEAQLLASSIRQERVLAEVATVLAQLASSMQQQQSPENTVTA